MFEFFKKEERKLEDKWANIEKSASTLRKEYDELEDKYRILLCMCKNPKEHFYEFITKSGNYVILGKPEFEENCIKIQTFPYFYSEGSPLIMKEIHVNKDDFISFKVWDHPIMTEVKKDLNIN